MITLTADMKNRMPPINRKHSLPITAGISPFIEADTTIAKSFSAQPPRPWIPMPEL